MSVLITILRTFHKIFSDVQSLVRSNSQCWCQSIAKKGNSLHLFTVQTFVWTRRELKMHARKYIFECDTRLEWKHKTFYRRIQNFSIPQSFRNDAIFFFIRFRLHTTSRFQRCRIIVLINYVEKIKKNVHRDSVHVKLIGCE